ncbi:MAG: dUTP diphosphatase [Gammaproteobacteria bacterium]|nr:MAG: dUTP diphosphatase [Gammaproteobacteria bacterium]
MLQRFITMLEMQDSMNRKVHPQWPEQGFEWYRAAWIECAELMEHYGYKWWKKQQPDQDQVELEIIDIWHFGMSALFDGRDIPAIAQGMCDELASQPPVDLAFRDAVEAVASHSLQTRSFSVSAFWSLLNAAGMSPDDLFSRYVGKNVLNVFRQDHGYKDGSYIKQWQGREDNEHLVEILAALDASREDYRQAVYDGLKNRYQQVLAGASA